MYHRNVADRAILHVGVPTGIDDPYEEPLNAELVLEAVDSEGNKVTPQVSAGKILEYLHAKQFI
jgi:adenylylsulfate kinase